MSCRAIAVAKSLAGLLFVASVGFAALEPPPTGCRLKVTNSGSENEPNYATSACEGECVAPQADPCTTKVFIGEYVKFYCLCSGNYIAPGSAQGCYDEFTNQSGQWRIICFKRSCVAECLEASLPGGGESVWACTCPDA